MLWFIESMFTIMLERGRDNLMMEWLKKCIDNLNMENMTEFWELLFTTAQEILDERRFKFIKDVIEETFVTLGHDDISMVMLFLKHNVELQFFAEAIEKRDESKLDYFKGKMGDPDTIFIPYKCRFVDT